MRLRLSTLAGWVRVLAWLGVVHVVTDPWRRLGGLVDERLRWTVFVAAAVAVVLGTTAAREGATAGDRRIRPLLYPPAVASLLALLALQVVGDRDAMLAVLTVLVSWTFGVDLVAGSVPLLDAARRSADPFPQKGRNRRI